MTARYCATCGTVTPDLLTISKKRGNGDNGPRSVWLPLCVPCASALVDAAGDRPRVRGFSVRGMRRALADRRGHLEVVRSLVGRP